MNDISTKQVVFFILKMLRPFLFHIGVVLLTALAWAVDVSFSPYLRKVIIDCVSTSDITESSIQEFLWELMQGKTTIVIVHRLSTFLHMDRILVFDQGKVVEGGTHQELLDKNGMYKTLWDAQVGGFLPDKKKSECIQCVEEQQ